MTRSLVLCLALLVSSLSTIASVSAQPCLDPPPMDGTVRRETSPAGWEIDRGTTPDLIRGNGPYPGGGYTVLGVGGLSQSGGEMGIFLSSPGESDGEGWRTTLTGLTAGTTYRVAVEWQQGNLSGSGFFYVGGSLYMDVDGTGMLFTTSGPGTDRWQPAVLTFTAAGAAAVLTVRIRNPTPSWGAIMIDSGDVCAGLCAADADCTLGGECTTVECTDSYCRRDVAMEGAVCTTGVCHGAAPDHECVECVSDTECPGERCDTMTNTCVECVDDMDCGDGTMTLCDLTLHACVPCTFDPILLMCVAVPVDGGSVGPMDAGPSARDGGATIDGAAGEPDARGIDGGGLDAGALVQLDAGALDGGVPDAARMDAGSRDAARVIPDAAAPDVPRPDAGTDAPPAPGYAGGAVCAVTVGGRGFWAPVALSLVTLWLARRKLVGHANESPHRQASLRRRPLGTAPLRRAESTLHSR